MKNDSGPRGIGGFLPPVLLNRLAGRLGESGRLLALWQRALPASLAAHTHPQHFEAGCLIVHADSPAWASRLRQQQGEIMQRLRVHSFLSSLTDLRVRIVPAGETNTKPAAPAHRSARALSDRTTTLLKGLAEEVRDPGLRESLQRLATRRQRKS